MREHLTEKIFAFIACIVIVLTAVMPFNVSAEEKSFKISLSAVKSGSAGDKINVICSVDSIKPSSGLCGVSFTLSYDVNALTPDIVSPNVEDTSPYNAFMTKVPTYTVSAGGTDVQAPAYENISRCFASEGKYTLMFIDLLIYPGIKSGTTVDSTLRDDGDLTLTIPFTVKANAASAFVKIDSVVGTTAGSDMKSVYGPDASIKLNFSSGEVNVITETEPVTTAAATDGTDNTGASATSGNAPSESGANASQSISAPSSSNGAQSASVSQTGKTSPSATEVKNTTKDSKTTAIIIAAAVTLIAVIAVILFYLKSKKK